MKKVNGWCAAVSLLGLAACDLPSEPVKKLSPSAAPLLATAPAAEFFSSGSAKPVRGLREYNGTFTGNMSSGTLGYSTLYRDNYASPYGWTGEGSGKHTGVDIAVGAGTRVYAVQGGVIVRARCEGGFGGHIIVKSTNVYAPSRSVYHTYAHLSDHNDRPEGRTVKTGEFIGLSGGVKGAPCAGFSSGAHLHYQIDNDNDNAFPHGRTSADSNEPDTKYVVNDHTYSPMLYVQGGYRWEFQTSGNSEFWTPGNVASWGVSDGAFWLDGNTDPWLTRDGSRVDCGRGKIRCSTQIAAEANLYRRLEVDAHMGGCWNPPFKVYFTTSGEPLWDESKSVSGDVFFGPVLSYRPTFNMAGNSKWKGIITGLRVDPAGACPGTGKIYIGSLRLM